ncbi:hypothetical protein [Mesobacillus jeotgali]|uniref:hypothetical protein n=1 Tax=Mesobacillus jeotgali TaxID=129985 RepID=UPI0009A7FC01|nr:hypothetical protein [Mesobacillus jeotgali]
MKLIERIKEHKGFQNILLLGLFALIFILPEENIFGDIAILLIIFLIAYISSYINVVPVWKGLFFSVLVTLIIVIVFYGTITLFPNISILLLMCIVALAGFLSTYLIG